jgi:hypothetical protein
LSKRELGKYVTYFFKKSWSTKAEMSRSGFPIPNMIPSDAICRSERAELRSEICRETESEGEARG